MSLLAKTNTRPLKPPVTCMRTEKTFSRKNLKTQAHERSQNHVRTITL